MKYYELNYLITPDLSTGEIDSLSEKISGFIKKYEGNIKEKTEPTRKNLGSPIKKKNEAILSSFNFHLNPERIKDLEKDLINESAENSSGSGKILRYNIINKKEPLKEIFIPKIIAGPFPAVESAIESTVESAAVLDKTQEKKEGKIKIAKVELKEIDKKIEEILNE